jgi:hypothetical protein
MTKSFGAVGAKSLRLNGMAPLPVVWREKGLIWALPLASLVVSGATRVTKGRKNRRYSRAETPIHPVSRHPSQHGGLA